MFTGLMLGIAAGSAWLFLRMAASCRRHGRHDLAAGNLLSAAACCVAFGFLTIHLISQ